MAEQEGKPNPDLLAPMPEGVREYVLEEMAAEEIAAWAPYDLSPGGDYCMGYLVLGERRLGHFTDDGGTWQSQWTDLTELSEAKVVDGLGMGLLRLNAADTVMAEYRFTNRHAKSMAQLHQQLKRRLSPDAKDDEEDRPARDEGRDHGHGRGHGHDHGYSYGADPKRKYCEKCKSLIPDWAEACPQCLQQRKVLLRLMEFIRPFKWRAIVGFVLALGVLGLGLLRPTLTMWILDDAIMGGQGALLGLLVMLMGITFVVAAVMMAVQGRLMAGLGMRVATLIRDRCYGHLHKLSLSYFSRKPTGSLITRVTSDSDRIWDFVSFDLIQVAVALLTFVGVGALLFYVNWRLAWLVLIPVPGMMVLMTVFHKKLHRQFRRIWHRWSAMTAVVADAIPGMRVIKAFGQEKREVGRFHERNIQVFEEESALIRIFTFFGPSMMLATQVAFIVIWAVGGYWCIRDLPEVQSYIAAKQKVPPELMTVGALVAFQGYMMMFYRPIHQVAHMSRTFNRAATSVQRIFEILDAEPEIFTRHDANRKKRLEGRVELRNVHFSYDGVRRVLQDIDISIKPGEMIGLVGHSGSGKTTLVNLICRFYDVLEGQILLDGVDIRDCAIEDLRANIGVVLQEPYLFRGTVAENIAYGNPGADVLDVIRAARAANVHDDVVSFPDGYDTMVGERGHTLSGGERQRVSIARAILSNPRLLILDEATSNVDSETEEEIQQALDRLVANRTTIAIAHRLSTLRRADRLVVLDKGRIAEQGTHPELAAKTDGVYAKLLKTQANQQSVMALKG